jgi:ectoine hydroxylase-related dioxygenase (phytanoyl-CoA dioxygenase family)
MKLTPEAVVHYREYGYVVVRGMFDGETAREMRDHYMALRAQGPKPGDFGGTSDRPEDPTHQFPRFIQMHNWDERSKEWATAPELLDAVSALLDDKPVLCQTMVYFKPPGGRGQGIHQDEQYITIDPLVGVWVALDRSDKDVGQMVVVPGTHKGPMLRVQAADTSVSFTDGEAVLPEGARIVGVDMEPGDTLFFHGKTAHGSYANVTHDRWRRSFICHYYGEHAVRFVPEPGTHVSHVKKAEKKTA